MRDAIPAGLKLAVTLHHLAEGSSHSCIAQHYRLGRSTVSDIIYDTCEAIYSALQPVHMRIPEGTAEWNRVSKE